MAEAPSVEPLYITMHERDNVAIVANDGGLPAGTGFPSGLTLVDKVPQGHKVALVDLAAGDAVLRYNVVIGRAARAIPAGSWVHERLLEMPAARSLEGLPIATVKRAAAAAARGLHLRGLPQRRRLGRHAATSWRSRTTVQCVAGVVEFAVQRIKDELLPQYPNVDDVVGLEHTYGCGVAIDAPDADRADPHAAQHQPEPELRQRGDGGEPGLREAAARAAAAAGHASRSSTSATWPTSAPPRSAELDVVCLQDDAHVGFMSMIDSIMTTAEEHLERLNARRRETVPGERARGRRAVRRQRRLQRRHRQPGGGLLHRPAGARRRDGDVLARSPRCATASTSSPRAPRRPRWPRR